MSPKAMPHVRPRCCLKLNGGGGGGEGDNFLVDAGGDVYVSSEARRPALGHKGSTFERPLNKRFRPPAQVVAVIEKSREKLCKFR